MKTYIIPFKFHRIGCPFALTVNRIGKFEVRYLFGKRTHPEWERRVYRASRLLARKLKSAR